VVFTARSGQQRAPGLALCAAALIGLAAGCETTGPDAPATRPVVPTYGAPPYGPYTGGYGQPPWPAPTVPAPSQDATLSERRRLDLTLDVPPGSGMPPWLDVRDPFATKADPAKPAAPARELPSSQLVVFVTVEKLGNHAARSTAARKLLASRGAVKRADAAWEIPTAEADRTPDALRAELRKLLCTDDRAALFFVEGGKLGKLEFPGDAACDAQK
jgi:hypothetical protein